ncbi:MAG: hypothetical protein HQK83_11595 [Fibrobacteria bacterium]|nr:hypothetical protein [Fibrobacteria bacterium]
MTDNHKQVTDLLLEQYVLGELPRNEKEKLDVRIQTDSDLQSRITRLRESNTSILDTYSPEEEFVRIKQKLHIANVKENIEQEARQKARIAPFGRRRTLVPAAVLSLVIVVMFSVMPFMTEQSLQEVADGGPVQTDDGIQIKGDARLFIFLKKGNGTKELRTGDVAHEGDLLQLKYLGRGDEYGYIFSLDGRGALTRHYPEKGGKARILEPGVHALPHSYELDDAPEFETFYFVSSNQPFELDAISDLARQHMQQSDKTEKGLALDKSFHQKMVILKKQ